MFCLTLTDMESSESSYRINRTNQLRYKVGRGNILYAMSSFYVLTSCSCLCIFIIYLTYYAG